MQVEQSHHFISKGKPTAAVSRVVSNTHNVHSCSLRLFSKMKKPQPAHKLIQVPNSNSTLRAALEFRTSLLESFINGLEEPFPPQAQCGPQPGKAGGGSTRTSKA